MLRITSGIAKNKRLKAPDLPDFRGVQEVMKGSVFSIIGEAIINSECLDLFAGSGNLGLEALSRGAAHCTFVDISKEAERALLDNIANCGFTDKADVQHKDSIKFAANTEKKYDFIFADPYYHTTSHIFLMQNLEEILEPTGNIFFFHGDNLDLAKIVEKTTLKKIEERRFGKSYFTILRK